MLVALGVEAASFLKKRFSSFFIKDIAEDPTHRVTPKLSIHFYKIFVK
jgi:hypothetical protein